jgi:hypothetical protein
VQGEDLVVAIGRQEIVVGSRQLQPHQQGQHAAERKEQQRQADVPQADHGVVDRRPVPPSRRDSPGFAQASLLRAPLVEFDHRNACK